LFCTAASPGRDYRGTGSALTSFAWLGELGASQLIYLVGVYSLVSMTLNGFDVPVPQAV
jgi:hypothetical protein